MDLGQLGVVLNTLSDPVMVIGDDQRVLIANRQAEGLFEPDLAGRHILSVIRQPDVMAAIQAVIGGQIKAQIKFVAHRAVDETYQVNLSKLTPAAGIGGFVAVFRDVTPIENAKQMRSDFVANVSHELRSPLTALSGFIETLQGPAANDAKARATFLAIMQTEATRMRRLIDDLLSLSRVEANERVRPTAMIDIVAVLAAVKITLAPRLAEQNIRLDIRAPSTAVMLPGDGDQLTQVFQNLIENAMKYGDGAEIAVEVSRLEKFAGIIGPAVRIDVRDTGAGIAPHHLVRLTERFYRIDNHRSRQMGGTGLGLAIVKHIASRHRGRLLIHSTKGQGSVFCVVLPEQ